ncbi:MAG: 4a-hydroxytetrahydrobiopterin dehydratase [Telluria sp.]|nr:4a-hydroxytetrahydrobiopterin dehydratase [Telluria sp.]
MTLLDKTCSPGAAALSHDAIAELLPQAAGWALVDARLTRTFALRDYRDTIAFVNALAEMVHREDHHPELLVTYKECTVSFSTHSANGVTENDFICAAKANAIYEQRARA